MRLRKRFNLFVLAVVLLGLSTFCYAEPNCNDDHELCGCGFSNSCPYTWPPCYRVEFNDVIDCETDMPVDYDDYYRLKYFDDELDGYPECIWGDDGHAYGGQASVSTDRGLGPPNFEKLGIKDHDGERFRSWGPHDACSFSENEHDCLKGRGYDGWASYEPVWDCNWCGNCQNLAIEVYKEPGYYFPNKKCCPVPEKGEFRVLIKCVDAEYVIPNCSTTDPNVAEVTSDPNGCSECSEEPWVWFHITTHPATPPLKPPVKVTCTALFYDEAERWWDSETVVITVKPSCTPCCENCAAGAGFAACTATVGACSSGITLP